MYINIDALYNILNQNQGDVNDALGYKKKVVVVTSDPLALVAEKLKITALLAKAFNRKKYYAKPTNNNLRTSSASCSANKKPEYVKTVEKKEDKKVDEKKRDMSKVHLDSDESSSSAEETIAEVAYYTSESKSESEYKTSEYYDNSTNYGLFVNDNDDQEFFHDAIESASENFIENHIDSQKTDKSEVDHNGSEEKEHLIDKLIQKFNHKIAKCHKRIEKANQQTKDLKNQNKDLQDKYDVLINQVNTFEEQNNEFNEQMKVLNEKNDDLLAQKKVLQDQLKVKHVVIDTHTECQAQYAKLKEERYEYMIRYSALCDNYKQHRKKIDEQEILFDKMSRHENDCQVVEECDQVENSKVIAPGMFKLSVSQSVSPIPMSKTSCDSKNVENKTKRKRHNIKSSKQNDKQVNDDVSRANRDFVHFSDLDTFSSVRRPKQSIVIWKEKWSSNTSNVDLSYVSHLKLNKDVKRYSCKNLLSCNNSHLGETSSFYVCNDAMNVSCNSRLCDSFDENNLFIFDDESVRISLVSKMPFRKRLRDSMNVHSKSNLNKSLPRTVHMWLPKMQPLAEPVAKWILRVERQIDKISKTPNSSGPIFKWVPKVC
uniref:Uncharacterized protein n=1 Tax=Tanacetum cinerariifolium TaxID=118510 RepID=A0A699JQ10_TANCI|nr:hypothetical protein [Tanacetum cinerariifolium]